MSKKPNRKKMVFAAAIFCGMFAGMQAAAKRAAEDEKIDENNPYRKDGASGEVNAKSARRYGSYVKPVTDKILSFTGFILLAPLMAAISLAIMADDPGPVFFKQRRVGKDGHFFYLHKFRSMKMCTPHDVPTHRLQNPEQYITRVGKVLRKTSLDELPQIWDIFRGKMSIVGPRPALWNQEDLVAERGKYGANSVTPGLTGWAQINGRDELEIAEKARLDGEYVEHLRQGGIRALFFDVRCLLGTIVSVAGSRGVVEGGTGELHRNGETVKRTGSRGTAQGGAGEISRVKDNGVGDGKFCKAEKGKNKTAVCRCAGIYRAKADVRDVLAEKGNEGNEVHAAEAVYEVNAAEAGFKDYGHLKHFNIDISENNKKRVLITGMGSYIGESFERWAKKHYPANFAVDTVDMQDPGWRQKDFSWYDAVFHVAGIAHADVGKVSEEEKKRYYAVNTDLAIETAEKAKAEGVKQFVFMSSMIIYGDSAPYGKEKVIDETTPPAPANFYGDSKWQADKGVRVLADGSFQVAVLRPPMIYGRGSKGNYSVLEKLAKTLPVFPDVENRRSMLYIDNLCEFLCKLMLSGEGGIYFPQNGEYVRTSEMVRQIAEAAGKTGTVRAVRKKIWVTKLLNPAVWIGSHVPGKILGVVNKAFGNYVYSQRISRYEGLEYQVASLRESVSQVEEKDSKYQIGGLKESVIRVEDGSLPYRESELKTGASRLKPEQHKVTINGIGRGKGADAAEENCRENHGGTSKAGSLRSRSRVLILVNHDVVIYNFRLELVERLLAEGYEVHISSPTGEHTQELIALGAHFHEISIDRHGMSPGADLQVFLEYRGLIKTIRPTAILTYTVKPNVYGGIAAQMACIPFVANITGLGTTLNQEGAKGRLVLLLYRLGLRRAQKVFFQNESNRDFMLKKHVLSAGCPTEVLPGSGVNLDTHNFEPYPKETEKIVFTTVGRIMHDKGTDELLQAAEKIKGKYPAVIFRLIGFFDEDYETKIREAEKKGIIEYVEQQRDIHPWMGKAHAILHPSHHEGMSNVLLEAAATGRPVLASDIPGCRETFDEGISGFGFKAGDAGSLVKVVEKFMELPYVRKAEMGRAGREKMERAFNRNIVVTAYMKELHEIPVANVERGRYFRSVSIKEI